SGGYYDLVSREVRGFNYVKQTLPNSTKVESWFYTGNINGVDAYKGLMYDQKTSDSNGNLYLEQVNTYQNNPPAAGVSFPALVQTDTYNYEGAQQTPQHVLT